MKLRKFLNNIDNLVKEYPEILEYEVVYSEDEEGNGFNIIYYEPSIGVYNKQDKEFYLGEMELSQNDIKVICIN